MRFKALLVVLVIPLSSPFCFNPYKWREIYLRDASFTSTSRRIQLFLQTAHRQQNAVQ